MTARVTAVPAALAAAALAWSASPAVAAPAAFHVAFSFRDPRIDEASGIALGRVSPGVAYVQNDSGDTNRFFAVNARTGATAATITVRGAHNVDWEDLAVAPSAAGASSVWLADIGDNDAVRSEVDVYRVPEPKVRPGAHNASITTPRAGEWRLRYPRGPVNAESLAVTPAGVAYIVTKSPSGHSVVYRLPPRPDRHSVQTLVPVARVRFSDPILYGRLATGAAISADGRWLIIRTYLAAYLWPLRDGDVAAALAGRRRVVPVPLELQGEGITFSGDRIYLDSEGRHTPVYVGRFPILTPPPPSPGPQPTARTSAAPAGAPTAAASRSGHATKPPTRSNRDWLAAVAAIAVLGAAVEYRRRRSRPDR
jgi:hypothetical protein